MELGGAAVTVRRKAGVDLPWLVPGALLPDNWDEGGQPARRTVRDWLVDVTLFLCSLLGGGAMLVLVVQGGLLLTPAEFYSDLAFGGISCLAVFLRRARPIGFAVGTAVACTVSTVAFAPSLMAIFTVAVHFRATVALVITALNAAAGTAYFLILPGRDSLWSQVAPVYALLLAFLAWGMFARARRQLVFTFRERADRAEAERRLLQERAERVEEEQRLLADRARQEERARIAREMHDVLAHRVSLIALHAGGLEVRPDLPADDVRSTAELIRGSARQALVELGDVIGVLRDDAEGAPSKPASPRDIPKLVEESELAGAPVRLDFDVTRYEDAPDPLARAAYRVVQEALTNVNKHAPGAETTVSVTGGPGDGLRVTVRSAAAAEPDDRLPGSGSGLAGLSERVGLVGGTLSYGPGPEGNFVVDAKLRWDA
ncbi:sensor histidine kinase [Amycolatopsis minnesotensis]|uniref:histidine kinase n=1 Tax=Amycolatopsis minnesotensis TaxID=337894 RepID=A0ABP5DIB8_9PSEU